MTDTQRTGLFYIILSAVGYAFFPTITKNIYANSDFQPLDIAIWRFLIATPVLWLIVTLRPSPYKHEAIPKSKMLILGAVFSGAAITAFFGLERVDASLYIVLFYTYPAIVVIISAFLGQRLSPVAWLALGLTFIGVILTVPDLAEVDSIDSIGLFLVLLNSTIVATYFLLSGYILKGYNAIARSTGWMFIGALSVMFVIIFIRGTATALSPNTETQILAIPQNTETWFNVILIATFNTVMPIFLVNAGIQKIGAPRASLVSTVEPVLGVIIAAIFLAEIILPVQWLGSGFIIAGVIILQLRPAKQRKTKRVPTTS